MRKSDSIAEITKALVAFQAELHTVPKGGHNPHFKSAFARMEDAVKAAQPIATKHGLALTQWPTGECSITTLLSHASGEWIESDYEVRPVKSDPQAKGSAITYGRRYAYLAALGLAPEDDDGNAASERPVVNEQQGGSSGYQRGPDAPPPDDPSAYKITFGKNRGKTLGLLSEKSLRWYAQEANDGECRAAAAAELSRREERDGADISFGDAPPPPDDDDLPF